MLFQNCIGLDIRSDRFNLVAVRSGFRETRVVAHATVSYDSHMDVADKTRVIGEGAGALIKKHHLSDAEIALMLPRELFIVREVRLPLSAKENLRATLGYEMQKYVPLPVGDIYFDYLIAEENRPENSLRILLFAIRKKDLDAYLVLPDYFGKRLSGIEAMPSALGGYLDEVLKNGFSGSWAGVIRSGSGNGDVCVYRHGQLDFTKHIRGDAAEGLDLTTDQLASHLTAAVSSQAPPPSTHQWLYFRDSDSDSLETRLKEKMGLELASLDGQDAGLPFADLIPAYGLAIQTLRNRHPRINLLPPDLRRKPNRSGYYTMLVLSLLVLLSAASWGGSAWVRHRLVMTQLDDTLQRLQRDVIVVEDLISKNDEMEQRLQQIGQLGQNRVSVLAVLQELSARVPLSAWIQELNFNKDNIQISGYAESASELLEIIEASPLFDKVAFISAITRTKDGKEQFRIGMGIQSVKVIHS